MGPQTQADVGVKGTLAVFGWNATRCVELLSSTRGGWLAVPFPRRVKLESFTLMIPPVAKPSRGEAGELFETVVEGVGDDNGLVFLLTVSGLHPWRSPEFSATGVALCLALIGAVGEAGSLTSRCRCNSAWCFFHQAGSPWNSPSWCWVCLSKGISCLYLHPCCVKAQTPS